MKILKLMGASLLMVSPFTFAETESEFGFDSNEVTLKENRGLATTGGAIKFATYAASSAQAIYSVDTFGYVGAGCKSNTTNSTMWFDESIHLPIESTIVSVGFFYSDSNNGGSSLLLQNYDAAGGIGDSVNVSAPAVSGHSSSGTFVWMPTTASEQQVLRFTAGATPSANPCMARIGYIPFDIVDDVIFAHKYEY